MQKLLEQAKAVRAEAAKFLFVELGIPFSLFCFSISLFVFVTQRQDLRAWWQHWSKGRDYRPNRELTAWEELDSSHKGLVRALLFTAVLLFFVGAVALFGGITPFEK